MSSQDKKMAVLDHLRQESKPISLKDLIEELGKGYPERSVRRWLFEMVDEGLIEKFGQKRGTKYQAVHVIRKNANCFGTESQKVIEKIQKPLYERSPVTYDSEWFESYEPNKTFYIPIDIRSQLYQSGRRFQQEEPAGTYAHQIFNRLLIDLSYNSSRLEGNTYSLLDTKRLLLEGAGALGKLDEEKVMILNHKEAIRYLVDTAPNLKVSKQTICTLHYLLSDGLVEAHYAGKVRDHSVRIGGSTYIPFEDSRKLQFQLEDIVKKGSLIEDPYEQSLFLLIHITYLQCFADVNKRTARLSANIPLIRNNLVPLSFNDVERADYMSAIIAVYELQNIHPILDLYVFSYLRTCVMYDSTIKAMGFDEVRVRYRQQRRLLIREIILKKLVGKSMQTYISSKVKKDIKSQDHSAFFEDVLEDLEQLDPNRIAGLGITVDQLKEWIHISKTSTE